MFKRICLFLCISFMIAACSQAAPTPTPIPTPAATATPTAVPIPPTPSPGTLLVSTAVSEGPISPYILGSNYGPWISVPVDMLPAAYDSKVTVIRFPGGAWGDRNDLKSYHIDYFMDFVEQVGAITTISANLRDGTPEQAADLVRYTNVENDYNVQYWSIGNEPTLFAAELQTVDKSADYDTERFNREWREFAIAMKEVDPSIQLVGPEIHQFSYDYESNPKDSSNRDWMIEFLKANGDMVDVVTFHRYPFPSGRDSVTIEDLRQQTKEWQPTIPYLRDLITEHTGRDLPIAITEVNTHWNQAVGGEATPDSHYNAIWLSEMFGQLIREDVFMVNHWLLTSQGGQGGWGLIGRSELRPSYYVYQLYSKFGDERLYAESGIEDVSIYAAKRDDGALTLMLNNLADEAKEVTLQIEGNTFSGGELWRLDQENIPEAANDFTLPDDGRISLPAQSVTLIILDQE